MDTKNTVLHPTDNLHHLSRILPLKAPLSMLVDPSNLCNFKCVFCPTGYPDLLKAANRPQGVMSFELFCKIVDDAQGFGTKLKKMLLYKDGEPFLNKNLERMIAYAKSRGISESVEVTSNGALMTPQRATGIIEAGLDAIRISVEHVHDEGYRKITQGFSDYATIVKNIKFLYEEKKRRKSPIIVRAKIIDVGLTADEKKKFLDDFSPITDLAYFESLTGWNDMKTNDFMMGMSESITTGIDGVSPLKRDRVVCPMPFKTLAINPNGSVALCSVDWNHKTVVGDVSKENLVDIWNGERLRQFRLMHLKGRRKELEACANCQYVLGTNPLNDLDAKANDLLSIYETRGKS